MIRIQWIRNCQAIGEQIYSGPLAASIHPHKTVLISPPGFLQLGINLLIIHGDAELAIHVAHRDAVMLLIMRINAILGKQDVAISLIGIDDSGANACMGVNASHDNLLAIEVLENRIQLCPKKGAVAFLNQDGVGRPKWSFGKRLAPSVPSMTIR